MSNTVDESGLFNISSYYFGVLLAMISAISMAVKMISRQRLIKIGMPHSVVNFQFSAFGTGVWILVYLCRNETLFDFHLESVLVALITGLGAVCVSVLYARALKNENVQVLGVLGALDIVYAVLLQRVFLNENCKTTFIVGACLIVLASLLVCSFKFIAKEKRNISAKISVC